jgi:hypothetical protein
MDLLKRIQNWYKINCNGDWEHSYGLSISNLDNPGWSVTIDLDETPFDKSIFEKSIDNGDDDWITVRVKHKKFEGHGDANKLEMILKIFLDEFIPFYGDKDFHYDIYEPIVQNGRSFYKKVKGRIKTEDSFEIIEVADFSYKELKADDFADIELLDFEKLKTQAKIKTGDFVRCDLKRLADYPTIIIAG